MDKADKYIELLQMKYPNLDIKWKIPPHHIFENDICIISFSAKSNPAFVLEVDYQNGIDEFSAEHNVDALVSIYGGQLEELSSL